MQQLTQKLKDGSMGVLEVPVPLLGTGMVLVQNHFSLISAGTEGGTVSTARKSLLGKAKERPQQVKQVLDTLSQQGPVQTYRAVMKKLDSYSPLGYSSAGVVVDVGSDIKGFVIGDYVACAGAGYANHAEIVAVPDNLCVKVPETADLSRATYNTLGAIALQGVRQADLRVGETAVVIGLGLLGQLSALILKASGVKVVGLDINSSAVETAIKHSVDVGLVMGSTGIDEAVLTLSAGVGADAVIITAATHSLEPINLAGKLLRQRGTVVIVGDAPTGFDREPFFYKKELSLKMSCSYGPGRYDLDYEEKGMDYPVGYVRWTEKRNMQAFQELVHSGKIDLDYLTTHRFPLDAAPTAYDLIVNRTEDFLGILLEYDADKPFERANIVLREDKNINKPGSGLGVAFLGAGSYAMSHLLPNLTAEKDLEFTAVMTSSGTSSRTVAEKYGFTYCAATVDDVLGDDATNTVFIATRHDSHATYVERALNAGKHVFVEKPLCLKEQELESIADEWNKRKQVLMVGFNRRFSPLAKKLKAAFDHGPMNLMYRVNAGQIPANTWIQDEELGGGRIVGEVCHFVDFLIYMTGSLPTRVYAVAMTDPEQLLDNITVTLNFSNGSIGTIGYYANGSKTLPKEYIEVYQGGKTGILRDFKELNLYGGRKTKRDKLLNQDKGQRTMVTAFLDAIAGRSDVPISFAEIYLSTLTTFKILESLRQGQAIELPGIQGVESL